MSNTNQSKEEGSFSGGRFDKTYCSQCGGEFGPGNKGFSHCKDHDEEQPVPDRALKLLDECLFYCSQAMEKHFEEEDRRGLASGLHEELRDYLIDVGYIRETKK